MSILSAISAWKKKLLDLTRRNRLLHFRASKTSTLMVSAPDVDAIYSRLVIEEKPWTVWAPEETEDAADESNQPSLLDPAAPKAEAEPKRLSLTELLDKFPPIESQIVLWPAASNSPLSKVLSNIYRRARSDYQEKGVRTLYLGMGQLCWSESGAPSSEEDIRSPIILVPVELSRATANDPFVLKKVARAKEIVSKIKFPGYSTK